MTVIRQQDFIDSVADALQYISYYHPVDYITTLAKAYEREQSPAAKDAMAQILINSRMCAEGHRPICQDTGIVNVFVKVGMDVRIEGPMAACRDEPAGDGQRRRAPRLPRSGQQAARLCAGRPRRRAQEHTRQYALLSSTSSSCRAAPVEITVAAKGGGAKPSPSSSCSIRRDSIVDWVLKTVPTMGAGWCPPGMLGIGIGGTAEKAMLLAKESLMDPIDMQDLHRARSADHCRRTARRNLRQGQSRSASARRASAASPPCSTSRCSTTPTPCRQPARRHDSQLRRHAPRPFCARRFRPRLS